MFMIIIPVIVKMLPSPKDSIDSNECLIKRPVEPFLEPTPLILKECRRPRGQEGHIWRTYTIWTSRLYYKSTVITAVVMGQG